MNAVATRTGAARPRPRRAPQHREENNPMPSNPPVITVSDAELADLRSRLRRTRRA
ncbi:hypothetical protein GCM10009654_45460 [Streptomyces hebeiensis]|uniref:Uncharacterized protein n=1 Tax=Streptomyces hebeiensis TaxID=229486 RepID=A0ABP4FL79_9ACTN